MTIRLSDHLKQMAELDETVLDIGAGLIPHMRFWNRFCKKRYRLDVWLPYKPDVATNLCITGLPFKDKSVDIIMMLDFIEHLEKDRGFFIIEDCKRVARKSILLMTPSRWSDMIKEMQLPGRWGTGNPFQQHRSLWEEEDFEGWNKIDCRDIWKHHLVEWTING